MVKCHVPKVGECKYPKTVCCKCPIQLKHFGMVEENGEGKEKESEDNL